MTNTVECPYCEYENKLTDIYDSIISDDNKFDWNCGHCGEDFEVYIEYEPTFSASEIIYDNCDSCNKSVRDIVKKGKTFPFPEGKYKKLCRVCYCVEMGKEYDFVK